MQARNVRAIPGVPPEVVAALERDLDAEAEAWVDEVSRLVMARGPLSEARDPEFEQQHPRDEEGKFTDKGGVGAPPPATSAAQVEYVLAAHIQRVRDNFLQAKWTEWGAAHPEFARERTRLEKAQIAGDKEAFKQINLLNQRVGQAAAEYKAAHSAEWEKELEGLTASSSPAPAAVAVGAAALTRIFGEKLRVDDAGKPFIRDYVDDLGRVPAPVLQRLAGAGARIHFGDAPVTELDENQDLKGRRVGRGWGNVRWDKLDGIYRTERRYVAVGNAGAKGTGSASVVIHETMHAIGHVFGHNGDQELSDAHRRLFPKLSPYLRQGRPESRAGRQELLAEGGAVLLRLGRPAAVRVFDEPFVRYLETKVLA